VFYCYAPFYSSSSNGVKVLYHLTEYLNQVGIDSRVLCFENKRGDQIPKTLLSRTIFLKQQPLRIHHDDVMIYSEAISGNPLSARKVVRFLENRPYYLTRKGVEYGLSIAIFHNCFY
jgi:hypothetical protein